jgi:hypothetical protein
MPKELPLMVRIALSLGLTAIAYVLLSEHAVLFQLFGPPAAKPLTLLVIGILFVLAWLSAPLLLEKSSDHQQWLPVRAVHALLIAASLCLILYFAYDWVLIPPVRVMRVDLVGLAISLALWSTIVLCVGLLRRRAVLFLGVAAFVWSLDIGAVLGFMPQRPGPEPPQEYAPWLTPLAALVIAWRMSASNASPAERVREPRFLWAFGALGALTVIRSLQLHPFPDLGYGLLYRAVPLLLTCLLPLIAFLAFSSDLRPTANETSHASRLELLRVCLGLSVVIATVFSMANVLRFGFGHPPLATLWGLAWPYLACLAVACGVMLWMRLAERVPRDPPGRWFLSGGLCLLGLSVVVLFIPSPFVLLFGSVLLFLVNAGKALVGIGMLRVMFNLQPPAVPASAQ